MRLKKTAIMVLSLLVSSTATISFADIYSDVANIAANSSGMNDLMDDYMPYMKTMDSTMTTLSDLTDQHYDWVENTQWKALTSQYAMSRALKDAVPVEMWSPEDFDEALKITYGDNSTHYKELKSAYAAQNPTITSENATVNVGQLTQNTYTQKAAIANTALATSQYTYEDVEPRVKTFDDLKAMIDSDTPNEKASIDLNTRVLVEIGYIQNEMLRLQSIQAQVQAMKAQQETNSDTTDQVFFSNN